MEVLKQFVKAAIKFASNLGELSIAFLSLVIAIIALVKSSKAEKLQTRINEMELKLKEYEVAKMEQEQKEATLACVEARLPPPPGGIVRKLPRLCLRSPRLRQHRPGWQPKASIQTDARSN